MPMSICRLNRSVPQYLLVLLGVAVAASGHAQGVPASNSPALTVETIGGTPQSATLRVHGTALESSSSPRVMLNGRPVSNLLAPRPCDKDSCFELTVTEVDGLHAGKNVVQATSKLADHRFASARLRFDALGGVTTPRPMTTLGVAPAVKLRSTSSTSYLAPTLTFQTKTNGSGQVASVQVGFDTAIDLIGTCTSDFTVTTLDRQNPTTVLSAPQCYASGSLVGGLQAATSSQIIVVNFIGGTGSGVTSFDTRPIGGSPFTTSSSVPLAHYIAIGTGGASPGQAYEFKSVMGQADVNIPAFANGVVQEDLNGNYNYQSSDTVEYVISPNDQRFPGHSVVEIGVPASEQSGGVTRSLYTSPDGNNGYYLLILDRVTLSTATPCSPTGQANNGITIVYANCGAFYATASPNQAASEYKRLAQDLNNVNPWQLAVLTTVGQPAYGNTAFEVVGASGASGDLGQDNGYLEFGPAIDNLGGSGPDTAFLNTSQAAYTLISSPGLGNSLTGSAVVSSTVYAQQKQSGFVHGLFQRDLQGHFTPSHNVQESQASYLADGGTDFTIGLLNTTQPIQWPELNTAQVIPTADSAAGQNAAYRYISWMLVNYVYISGASGSHRDDLHFYFTGSNNGYIDYHTFSLDSLAFPSRTTTAISSISALDGRCDSMADDGRCIWKDPMITDPNAQSLAFSQNDFNAVRNQLKKEIVDFTNVMQFMVNGSTNMKDVIAGGNANTALALVGAAATVKGSDLAPNPSQTVTFSAASIVNLVGTAVNIAAVVTGDGVLASGINKSIGVVSDLLSGASTVAGGLSTQSSSSLPSPQYTFVSTIGELANQDLQGQMNAGFDVLLDSILSDWGRLSVIGPKITDSDNPGFYSPNQTTQNLFLQSLNQAAQRSFYLALAPVYDSVYYWPTLLTSGSYPVDLGHIQGAYDPTCESLYQSPTTNLSILRWPTPTYGGSQGYFNSYSNPGSSNGGVFVDMYVIGKQSGKLTDGSKINFIDADLAATLFSAQGLNLPLGPALGPKGPFEKSFVNIGTNNPTGYPNKQICSTSGWGVGSTPGHTGVENSDYLATTTTLTGPDKVSSTAAFRIVAKVTSSKGAAQGSVNFNEGNIRLGTAPLDGFGTATLEVTALSLGTHNIVAYYVRQDPYQSSWSSPLSLTAYSLPPDFSLDRQAGDSASISTVALGTPAVFQVAPRFGFIGGVSLSCTGLPAGWNCGFSPDKVTLSGDQPMTFRVTVNRTLLSSRNPIKGVLLSALIGGCLFSACRRTMRQRLHELALYSLLLLTVGVMAGCGSTATAKPTDNTSSSTILINASSGSVTHSVAVNVLVPSK